MKLRQVAIAAGGLLGLVAMARTFRMRPEAAPIPGTLRIVDGEVVHYVDRGEGPAMILIHGFGGNTYSWRSTIDAFAGGHRVVALDLPGFGFSDRTGLAPLGHEDHARRVFRLMDELGIDRAMIVGHSMGGAVAQRMAVQSPERVAGLVLVCSVNAGERRAWDRAVRRLRVVQLGGLAIERNPPFVRRVMRQALKRMVYDPATVTDEMVEAYATPLARPGTGRSMVQMAHDARAEPLVDLGTIEAPTLVISGETDRVMPPSTGEAIAHGIPGARHVVMPETAHMLPDERPGRLNAELGRFLAELTGRQAGIDR